MAVSAKEKEQAAPATDESPASPPDAGAPTATEDPVQAFVDKAAQEGPDEDETPSEPAEQPAEEPGAEAKVEEQAAGEEEVSAEEKAAPGWEFTDEFRDQFIEAFGDELWRSPALQERHRRESQSEVGKARAEFEQGRQAQGETQTLIQQGQAAIEGLLGLVGSAKTEFDGVLQRTEGELGKARKGEDFDARVVGNWPVDPERLIGHVVDYGASVAAAQAGHHNRAFQQAIEPFFPQLTVEDGQQMQEVINMARRMRNDPAQDGRDVPYLTAEFVKILWNRAQAVGEAHGLSKREKQAGIAEQMANKNAVTAATANVAAARQKVPPRVEGGTPGTPQGGATPEAYRAAKERGDTAEAQRIVDEMARLGAR